MGETDDVRRALRLLQQYDEIQAAVTGRYLLLEAQTALGRSLGLDCTGVREGEGFYSHNGDTCPIHEWLDPADQAEISARHGEAARV